VQTFFIVEAFDPNLQLKLPRTLQRALINLAIEDAIAGEESSCKQCFHLVAFEIQSLRQMRCVFFHSQSWIILAPNDLGREFSRLQSGLDAVLRPAIPDAFCLLKFSAYDETTDSIWCRKDRSLCRADAGSARTITMIGTI
jgi:hypothetical protein